MKKILWVSMIVFILMLSGCVTQETKILEGQTFIKGEDGHFYNDADVIYVNDVNGYEVMTFSFASGQMTVYGVHYYAYRVSETVTIVCQDSFCTGDITAYPQAFQGSLGELTYTHQTSKLIGLSDLQTISSFYRSLVFMFISFALVISRNHQLEKQKLDKKKSYVRTEQDKDKWLAIWVIMSVISSLLVIYFSQFI
jgi:hypothetical protein